MTMCRKENTHAEKTPLTLALSDTPKGGVTHESKHRTSPSLFLERGTLLRVTTFESQLTKITVN